VLREAQFHNLIGEPFALRRIERDAPIELAEGLFDRREALQLVLERLQQVGSRGDYAVGAAESGERHRVSS
jgi:hypothetical protein